MMGSLDNDERFLRLLALALVDHPRATLQELATSIGVSKATLYRFCRTRDQLVDRLMSHTAQLMKQAIVDADLQNAPPADAIKRLIANHLSHSELTIFLVYHWKPDLMQISDRDNVWLDYENALDVFFLRGQREGAFRIDVTAAALTEIFIVTIAGLVDAEHRGRVARASLAILIEQMFLHGAVITGRAPGHNPQD
jgi:TetR/AcrR family transcriptional repressor of mexCD-oprJ operon